MDKLEKSRQLLSTAILKNFVGRITGAGLDRIVGSNPENVLLVGKLMSTNDLLIHSFLAGTLTILVSAERSNRSVILPPSRLFAILAPISSSG